MLCTNIVFGYFSLAIFGASVPYMNWTPHHVWDAYSVFSFMGNFMVAINTPFLYIFSSEYHSALNKQFPRATFIPRLIAKARQRRAVGDAKGKTGVIGFVK